MAPQENTEIYTQAANRFISSTERSLIFYRNLHIGLLVFSLAAIGIALYLMKTDNIAIDINKLLGTGTVFSVVLIYSLYQLQRLWSCKNSCDIAIFHLDLREHKKAFEFMKQSTCLKSGGEEILKKVSY